MCYVCTGELPEWVEDGQFAHRVAPREYPYHAAVREDGTTLRREDYPDTWDAVLGAALASTEAATPRENVRMSAESRLRRALRRASGRVRITGELDDILQRARTRHEQLRVNRPLLGYPDRAVLIMSNDASLIMRLLDRLYALSGPRNRIKFIGLNPTEIHDAILLVDQLTEQFQGTDQIMVIRFGDVVAPHAVERLLALLEAEEVETDDGRIGPEVWNRVFQRRHPVDGHGIMESMIQVMDEVRSAIMQPPADDLTRITFVASTANLDGPTQAEIASGVVLGAGAQQVKEEDLVLIGAVYYTREEVARMDMGNYRTPVLDDPFAGDVDSSGRAFSWPSSLERAPHWHAPSRSLRVYMTPYGDRFLSYGEDELEEVVRWV